MNKINLQSVIPDDKISIHSGGIIPIGSHNNNWIFKQLDTISERYNFDLKIR